MNSFAETDGAYVPLRGGMPIPAHRLLEGPQVCLSFNQDWLPAVLTSLKLLARPESWLGGKSAVALACQDGHTFPDRVVDCGAELPAFIAEMDTTYGGTTGLQMWSISTEDYGSLYTKVYLFRVFVGAGGAPARCRIIFHRPGETSLVGVNVRSLRLLCDSIAVFTLLYVPCVPPTFFDSVTDDAYERLNEAVYSVAIDCSKTMFGLLVVDTPILCEQA